ncbi:LacI family DNA-binding transcriptional regulator [Kiloniella majae]|uniref:LacI family DNA-binding transcriptional regulator n=1 Tax=Kiloniella majae TaxID=1938558 RepID=UPI000A277220|nr:LacI family DNA-binding transcriptional regulator [Kiloniella majae]
MKQKFLLKSIAYQAGLSLATVDRVVHKRGNAKQETVLRVQEAIRELEKQRQTAQQAGKAFILDVIMEAPGRFSKEVQKSFEKEMSGMRPASFRCRFHLNEIMTVSQILALLNKIRQRGSHGLILKVPDLPEINQAVQRIVAAGIPVVSFVTDIPQSNRLAYIGMNNYKSGQTAGYLMKKFLGNRSGQILLTLSRDVFQGEEERESGFKSVFSDTPNQITILRLSEGRGDDTATKELAFELLSREKNILAVYSAGGGNKAILESLGKTKQPCQFFIAHDLDRDNVRLLQQGKISLVIYHNLRQDARRACQLILRHHRLLPSDFTVSPSEIGIATPYNIPRL